MFDVFNLLLILVGLCEVFCFLLDNVLLFVYVVEVVLKIGGFGEVEMFFKCVFLFDVVNFDVKIGLVIMFF